MNDHKLGWVFGFALLFGLYALAGGIAFWHVEEKTSFGLKELLDILKSLLTFWAGWKFSRGPFMPEIKPPAPPVA